jgi:hypothetical protein
MMDIAYSEWDTPFTYAVGLLVQLFHYGLILAITFQLYRWLRHLMTRR